MQNGKGKKRRVERRNGTIGYIHTEPPARKKKGKERKKFSPIAP